jgi:hypothetical protein
VEGGLRLVPAVDGAPEALVAGWAGQPRPSLHTAIAGVAGSQPAPEM